MQNNISKQTIIRTVVLFFALVNQFLTIFGKNPLPFSENEVYTVVSGIVTTLASIWAWWQNNSFTKEAIEADKYLESLIEEKKAGKE